MKLTGKKNLQDEIVKTNAEYRWDDIGKQYTNKSNIELAVEGIKEINQLIDKILQKL